MSLSMALFTFINGWWIMLFFVIPFMIEPASQERDATDYAAAPKRIYWKKAVIATTIASAAVTVLLALLMASGWMKMRNNF